MSSPPGCDHSTAAPACSLLVIVLFMEAPTLAHPVVVTPEVLAELRRLIPLAPLHQPL